MHYNEPRPVALDHEVTFNWDATEFFLNTNANSPMVLRIDEQQSSLFPLDHSIDPFFITPVDVKTLLQVGETGIKFISAIFIHLNLTFNELYEQLSFECEPPNGPTAKVYVNVTLRDGTFRVHIQTPHVTIHDAEYKVSTR